MSQSQTTTRKRVTREDIRKREIKLDIVDRQAPPPLTKRLMTLVILPIILWVFDPAHGALWAACAATALWIGFFGMLLGERNRGDFDTGREILLSIMRAGAFGLAVGCWGFVVAQSMMQ